MINPKLTVVVGIPCSRPVVPEWAVALACQNWPLNTNVGYIPLRHPDRNQNIPIAEARTLIAQAAIDIGAPYLFFIDDDVEMPIGGARQLLQTMQQADEKVMIVGGIYPNRNVVPTEPVLFQEWGGGTFWKWKKNTIFEVKAVIGTGCMMIRTEVFKHIEKPWFNTIDTPQEGITDDSWFCDRVTSAGFKMLADAHVICTHWDSASQMPYRLAPDSYPMIGDDPTATPPLEQAMEAVQV